MQTLILLLIIALWVVSMWYIFSGLDSYLTINKNKLKMKGKYEWKR